MGRRAWDRLLTGLIWFYVVGFAVVLLHYGRRVFVLDRFNIPSESMAPTLVPGDKVYVNKLIFGARIYTSFDFDSRAPLRCFRLPGLRKIRPGDVICFNRPYGYDDTVGIAFNIEKVYCKRVLGTPGDRIGAVDGHCWNDRVLCPIGVVQEQDNLRWMFDSIFHWNNCYDVLPLSSPRWNIKNWGPLVVPANGMNVTLDSFSRELYRQVIEYETGRALDSSLTEYTFQGDYYFAVGDNAMNSSDSRYWGFIPEDFIIGIVGARNSVIN